MNQYCSACLYEKENCYCKHGSFVEINESIPIKIRKNYMIENWDKLKKHEKIKVVKK